MPRKYSVRTATSASTYSGEFQVEEGRSGLRPATSKVHAGRATWLSVYRSREQLVLLLDAPTCAGLIAAVVFRTSPLSPLAGTFGNTRRFPSRVGQVRGNVMLSTILIIVLVLLLIGALPTWPYSSGWGYYPGGGLGLVLIIVLVLALSGRI